jgi:hypothetical protein
MTQRPKQYCYRYDNGCVYIVNFQTQKEFQYWIKQNEHTHCAMLNSCVDKMNINKLMLKDRGYALWPKNYSRPTKKV